VCVVCDEGRERQRRRGVTGRDGSGEGAAPPTAAVRGRQARQEDGTVRSSGAARVTVPGAGALYLQSINKGRP
jgi:hypothetical protein